MTEYFKLSFGDRDGFNLSYSLLKDTDNMLLVTFTARNQAQQPVDPIPRLHTDIFFSYEKNKYLIMYLKGIKYYLSCFVLNTNPLYQARRYGYTNYVINYNEIRESIYNKTNKQSLSINVNGNPFMLLISENIYKTSYGVNIPKDSEWSFYNGMLYSNLYKNFAYIKNNMLFYDYTKKVINDITLRCIYKAQRNISDTIICSEGFKGTMCEIDRRLPCSNKGYIGVNDSICECDMYNNSSSDTDAYGTAFYSRFMSSYNTDTKESILTSTCSLLDKFKIDASNNPNIVEFNKYKEEVGTFNLGIKGSTRKLYYDNGFRGFDLHTEGTSIKIERSAFTKNGYNAYTVRFISNTSPAFVTCFKRYNASQLLIPTVPDELLDKLAAEVNPVYCNWNVRSSIVGGITYYHFLNLDIMRFLTFFGNPTNSDNFKFTINPNNYWVNV